MFSEATKTLLARMHFRNKQLTRWMWTEHKRNLRSAGDFFFDMTNGGAFAFFDWLDETRSKTSYKRARGLFWAGLFGALGYFGYRVYGKLETLATRLSVCDKDEEFVKLASSNLEWVLIKFVFQNEYICRMLGDILGTNVFQSARIRFMLGRTLARVISNDYITKNLTDLTIHSVLSQNVFPNEAVYGELKALIVRQLRGEELRGLMKGQAIGFFGSDVFLKLAEDGLADTLRLSPVINSFVKGVVDDAVYKMLQSKDMARKLDQQLYEVLK